MIEFIKTILGIIDIMSLVSYIFLVCLKVTDYRKINNLLIMTIAIICLVVCIILSMILSFYSSVIILIILLILTIFGWNKL